MKKAFVFDLFGTLVEIREKSVNRKLLDEMSNALNLEFEDFYKFWSNTYDYRMIGKFRSINENINYILEKMQVKRTEKQIDDAVKIRTNFVMKSLENKRENLIETLSNIRGRGYKIGLISDCSPDVPKVWTTFGYDQYFDTVIFSSEVGIKKPNPKIYQKMVECLNVDFDECYYIGDGGSNELTGASEVGMHPILIKSEVDEMKESYAKQLEKWNGERIYCLSELVHYG